MGHHYIEQTGQWTLPEGPQIGPQPCCDFFPHPEASSSRNLHAARYPPCPQQNHSHPQTYLDPTVDGRKDQPCAFDAYCCHDEYCEETAGAECCDETECGKEDECCDGPACEVEGLSDVDRCKDEVDCACAHTTSLQAAMCSGMDCGQMEQYLDCCRAACLVDNASPSQNMPPPPSNTPTAITIEAPSMGMIENVPGGLVPSPNMALMSLLSAAAELGKYPAGPMTQSQASMATQPWNPVQINYALGGQPAILTRSSASIMAPLAPTPAHHHGSEAGNVCHWANCHRTFSTVHALLMHLSEDHLSTPAQLAASAEARAQAERQKQIEAETNHLLACLWDDCLPLPSSAHAFDPSSMDVDAPVDAVLRHVLNDHLGGPSCFPDPASFRQPCVTHAQIQPQNSAFQPQNTPPTPQLMTPASVLSPVFSTHSGGYPSSLDLEPQSFERKHSRTQSSGSTGAVRHRSTASQRTAPHAHPHSHVHPHHHAHPHQHQHSHIHNHAQGHSHSHSHLHAASDSHIHRHAQHSSLHEHNHFPVPDQPEVHVCRMPGCSMTFSDTASLTEHISDDHIGRGKRTYECEWEGCCGEDGKRKIFASRQKITRHLQSHTGFKPYVCEICDQAFSEAAPLTAHMRRHSKEKPYKCTVPGCDKAFSIAASLTIHLRTHRGEKPFVCPHCDKGFVEASNLTKHIRTHTGERPFPCLHPGCGKRFSRPDQLKRHGSVHTKNLARSPKVGTARTSRASSVAQSSDSSSM